MSTMNQPFPNGTLGTDDNKTQTANDAKPNTTKQQVNETETPSPVSPGKYNINWDEIDESFNPFGSKAGPLKMKTPATNSTSKVTVASSAKQDGDAETERMASTEQSNHVTNENKLEDSVENRSPDDGAPPYNTQTSKPLPDIFDDKPLGTTAKWDQVDWDAADKFDDPSKAGIGTGDNSSKKSTVAKPVPTTKKKETISGEARVKKQPNKVDEPSVKEAVADVGVSDTSESPTEAKLLAGKSGTKADTVMSNNDPGEKNGQPQNSIEPQSPSPVSPGKYNINWDEIDESFNPFGSKAGPLKMKTPAVKPTPKMAAVPQSNQDAVAKTKEKTITEKPATASEPKEPKLSAESASPQDGPPPLSTQKSNPLPDIFDDKPLGTTAKWDQVDWDAADKFDDPSKTGIGTGDNSSKKSTVAKPVPTTKKKETISGEARVKKQPNKVDEPSVKEAFADVGVSDTSRSGVKAKPIDGNSGDKPGNTNANDEQSKTREESTKVTETDSPTSPGKYNINWDEIDESFNPFGPKAGPLTAKPPLAKTHLKVAAASKADKTKAIRNSKDPIKPPPSLQDAPMDHQPLTNQGAYDVNWDELGPSSDPFGKSGPRLPPKSPSKVSSKADGPNDEFSSNQSHSQAKLSSKSNTSPSTFSTNSKKQPIPVDESYLPNGNGVPQGSTGTVANHNGIPQTASSSNPGAPPSPSELAEALELVARVSNLHSDGDESDDRKPTDNEIHPSAFTVQPSQNFARIDSSTRPASPAQSGPLSRPSMDGESNNSKTSAPVTVDEVSALRQERDELMKTIDEMRRCISEYDRSLQHVIEEKSQGQAQVNVSVADLIAERDQAVEEVATIEKAFGDLHRRFEKSKQVIEGFKQNEESLKRSIEEYKNLLQRQENKYLALKKHAEEKLLKVSQDTEAAKQEAESNIARLQAALRMLELQNKGLEAQLEQKKQENAELTKICEELLNKYSGAG
ncbi:hypothetical protein PHET_00031 [Paragonimus heterotremus]|uniref:Transforming acidic coiled-coil-containing protein C-terminal domain-containing protein n=1 Tax=Paragonimus heterotremus TaxID=100268 RepID=A0A8J4TFI5_9TREM|nr:hypothetical protein PHET_00031 [Paragonimus heterotremus]